MDSKTKYTIGLDLEEFSTVFPFHIIFGENLEVYQVGPSSREIFEIGNGSKINEFFHIKYPDLPFSVPEILNHSKSYFILESIKLPINLRGQMLRLKKENLVAFIGSPFSSNLENFNKSGLKLSHFATHEPIIDYLLLLQTQKTSLDDAKLLSEKILIKNKSLKKTKDELEKHTQNLEEIVCSRTKELETEKNKAETANRAKSEFLSKMSHELRTPLSSIMGFTQLMLHSKKNPLTEPQKNDIRQILHSSQHLLELINDILDLSQIEKGKLSVFMEPVSLHDLYTEILGLVKPIADKAGILLIDEITTNNGVYVVADRIRLKQILLNFLTNGIKYNKPKGWISAFSEILENGKLRINIVDTGKGIAEKNLKNLFNPFDRLGEQFSSIQGTGIGLALAKQLITLMNGEIGVTSNLAEGSRFYVDLEIDSNATAKVFSNTPRAVELPKHKMEGKKKVLCIEDNPRNLKLVERILSEHENLQLLSAPDGEIGLDIARSHQPELILMDINLPGIDGYETFQQLKKFEETKKIPVVAISANAREEDIQRALDDGFQDYLTKPIKIETLLNTVKKYLEPQ